MGNEIIIYRSPAEKMVYDYWMQPENFVHGCMYILGFTVAAWAYFWCKQKWNERKRRLRMFGK